MALVSCILQRRNAQTILTLLFWNYLKKKKEINSNPNNQNNNRCDASAPPPPPPPPPRAKRRKIIDEMDLILLGLCVFTCYVLCAFCFPSFR